MSDPKDIENIDNDSTINEIDNFDEPDFAELSSDVDTFNEEFDESFDMEDDETSYDNFDDDFDTPSQPQKSGLNIFNIAIVGIAVIGIGVLAYSFLPGIFGGGSTATPQPQQNMAQQNTPETEVAEQPSLLDNPDFLASDNDRQPSTTNDNANTDEIFQVLDGAPSLSSDEMDEIFAAIPNAQQIPNPPSETDISSDTLPMPSDVAIEIPDLNNFDLDTTPDLDLDLEPVNEPITPLEITNIIPETPSTPVVNTQIDDINARIDSMNNSMETFMQRLETRLDAISSSPSQPQTITVDNSAQINQLTSMIENLESRIDSMSAQQTAATPVVTSSPAPTPQPLTPIIEMEPEPVVQKTEPPKKAPTASKAANKPYSPPPPQWELRGASNGQAILAMKGTQNLQTVTPGTNVRGLGRVTSIAMESGRWVVRATNGTVRQ